MPKNQCDRLQRILNAAPRVICVIPKFNHVTPFIIKLVTCLLLNSVQDSFTRFEGARSVMYVNAMPVLGMTGN